MRVFAIEGALSRELMTFMGRVIVHDNLREMEFLFPKYRDGRYRFVEVDLDGDVQLLDGRGILWLKDHPDMDLVRWPLREQDFIPLTGETKRQLTEKMLAVLHRS